jgi:hypothetical protein
MEAFDYTIATTPVVNGAWTYTVTRTLANGTWSLIVGDPVNTVPLTSATFTVNTPTVFGTYDGYMNGALFIETLNISQADALANCTLNATNNPTKKLRCFWNGQEIFNNTGVTCTAVTPTTCATGYTSSPGGMDPNSCPLTNYCVLATKVTLTPNKTVYAPGEGASISWNVSSSGAIGQTWITIVPAGMVLPNSSWGMGPHPYIYTDGNKIGTKTIATPSTTGQYEFVYYDSTGYTEAGRGGGFIVSSTQGDAGTSNLASALVALEAALRALLVQLGR